MFKNAAMWIAMVFVLMNTGLSAQAATDEATGLVYEVLEDGTVEITGYSGSAAEVVIPEEIEGMTVTSIGMYSLAQAKITSIELPETITNISEGAFFDSDIASFEWPEELDTIEEYVFGFCDNLTAIHIPQNVTKIGATTFSGCSALETITVDENNTVYMAENNIIYSKDKTTLFQCGAGIKLVEVPSGVTYIGERAFAGCEDVEKIVLPESVVEIGMCAFSDTSALTEIELPESLEKIGIHAFSRTGLKKIHIPAGVTSIGQGAFSMFTGEITVDSNNGYYLAENNILFNKDKTELIRYAGNEQEVVVGEGVEFIGEEAFASTVICNVTLPSTLKEIGFRGFYDCVNLQEITIPKNVQEISGYAFDGCENLAKIIVLNKDCYIARSEIADAYGNRVFPADAVLYGYAGSTTEEYAEDFERQFEAISEFQYQVLEDGTLEITGYTGSSTEVVVPAEIDGKSVTKIGFYAFEGSIITKIELPEGVTTIGHYAFENAKCLEEVILPNTLTEILDSAFYACSSLETIEIPDSVEYIGSRAFGFSGLTEVFIPSSVKTIEDNIFFLSKSLNTIEVDKKSDYYMVEDKCLYTKDKKKLICCEGDTQIVVVEDGTVLAAEAFAGNKSLIEVKLPESLKEIPSWAFMDCANLEKVNIPDSVERIGRTAFDGCKALKGKLDLPESLTSIESYAFTNCSSLSGDLIIPKNVVSIGSQAFQGCTGMNKNIYISENTTSIDTYSLLLSLVVVNGVPNFSPDMYSSITIHAPKGSYAEMHANELGYSFEEWDGVTLPNSVEFEDIQEGAYYESPVQWAVANGITNGYGSNTTFCPDLVCTRGQIVTFLWRAKGCPEPTSLDNPFTDVASDAYYYKAVLWAVEQGITNGYGSDTIFNPDGECTRGQVATFMWRAEGQPTNSGNNPFVDLDASAYYYDAVLWAVEKGVTNGYGSTDTFCPDVICTRGQIVTFLYRGMN